MSTMPQVRRADKLMPDESVQDMIARGQTGRLGTAGPDGWPYIVPLLYVWIDDEIWVHNTRARGHLRSNVDHESKVCFEIDEPGEVFPYGRFECDTSIAYRSVVAFGRIRIVEDRDQKQRFCEALMAKYGDPGWERPPSFFPRLNQITVYAIAIERITGKETSLPPVADQWPAADHTKTPDATP
jgi:nitroimidazol reductase NimA-like FMN-containing flavoprotein (pyridoxamine 5'-phosphate oxidase superfamily)